MSIQSPRWEILPVNTALLRRIVESCSEPTEAGVNSVVELDDSAVWPEPGVELLTGNYLARPPQ